MHIEIRQLLPPKVVFPDRQTDRQTQDRQEGVLAVTDKEVVLFWERGSC